jgi:hypothetical protein
LHNVSAGRSSLDIQQSAAPTLELALPRGQLMAALLLIASINGLIPQAAAYVGQVGWLAAIADTFGISIIVWAAWISACYLSFQLQNDERLRRTDLLVAGAVVVLVAAPTLKMSWLGVCLLAAYVFFTSPKNSAQQRGAVIFFAMCVPMFWGPTLFTFTAAPLLDVDAFLVSSLLGVERTGNLVQTFDSIHRIQIWPGCSSFHNISQAALAWLALSQTLGRRLRATDILWCGLAISLAFTVNLIRLALFCIFPDSYATIHGPIGSQTAGALTLILITVVCIFGLRRELFARG